MEPSGQQESSHCKEVTLLNAIGSSQDVGTPRASLKFSPQPDSTISEKSKAPIGALKCFFANACVLCIFQSRSKPKQKQLLVHRKFSVQKRDDVGTFWLKLTDECSPQKVSLRTVPFLFMVLK